MRVYLAPRVLITDEIGYLPLGEFDATIGDPVIATAILDRLFAPLQYHQHPRRELPVEGSQPGRSAITARGPARRGAGCGECGSRPALSW
jgi:hypothetical protein